MRPIDLNADLGEGSADERLYALISSANVACGGHAGDDASMHAAVRLAIAEGVAIGAHPAYPDREGFGRRSMAMPAETLAGAIADQIGALVRVAAAYGGAVTHVKPHGALYNDAVADLAIAGAIAEGVRRVSDGLIVFGLAGSPSLAFWRERGLRTAAEGFADRAYREDGALVPRPQPGALIVNPERAAEQAVMLAGSGRIDTLCVHSDTPGALDILESVRRALIGAGWSIASLAPPGARN